MEALRHDFSTRRRERCVRLDLLTSGSNKVTVAGLDELERLLREAVKASFEARQAAYDDEVPPSTWPFAPSPSLPSFYNVTLQTKAATT